MAKITNVFSTNLQALRKKKGVTQEQLALYLGVSPQAVSKWENGSYPEGDLLPKISEYFEVSISYLYGQETEKKSFEQTVLDELYTIHEKENEKSGSLHKEYFDKLLDIAWSGQIACWKNNKYYYKRGIPEEGVRTASVVSDDAGFGYFNLNLEKQYYALVREPEDGFSSHLKLSEGLRGFFRGLGEPGVLEILFFLLSMQTFEAVSVSTLSEITGMDVDKVQLIMDRMTAGDKGGRVIQCVKVVKTDGVEKAYSIEPSGIVPFITLLLSTESLMNPPYGYTMQVGNRDKAWFDREKVIEMIKEVRNGRV
ncbi:MAG: helix-turn-helix transcriptional regulator [Lachnospiraceae bacterium]|nr:helix-turn-helix transcriptional regulator [Lachnospiraceae bacterium]MBR5177934.1 helix-turn-helix transcriptional regulator [Lachnospiraceae bacterium]